MTQLTDNARAFVAANKESPVVAGSAIGRGGEGCVYELDDGRSFTLDVDECGAVGVPRWKFDQ